MVLLLDGEGVRTLWNLLALQQLMRFIADREERDGIAHSFFPQAYPEDLFQSLLQDAGRLRVNEALSGEDKIKSMDATRRYLPCHYFDHICGSGTGS